MSLGITSVIKVQAIKYENIYNQALSVSLQFEIDNYAQIQVASTRNSVR